MVNGKISKKSNDAGDSTVLIGAQYGDEGKARVLDKIMGKSDFVARFNGGNNAGHSLEVDGMKIVLHQIPSGIFYPGKSLYIGSGCVVNPIKIFEEIKDIESKGISLDGRLHISSNASLVQPSHLILDSVNGKGIGTTMNGIGPAYADIANRAAGNRLLNIKLGDVLQNHSLFTNIEKNLELALGDCGKKIRNEHCEFLLKYEQAVLDLSKYVENNPLFLDNVVSKGKNVFFEGAQSVGLDPVYGIPPYVTSSRPIAAAAYTGGDLSLKYHDKTIAVAKAIMSRVGNGPFISEFGGNNGNGLAKSQSEEYCMKKEGKFYSKEVERKLYSDSELKRLLKSNDLFEVGIALRIIGNEYGASTGRPRRIGALDLVMLRQVCKMNGVDELYLNKVDLLKDFSKTSLGGIPIVVAYELGGKIIDYMPTSEADCRKARPIFDYLDAFTEDLSHVRKKKDLPKVVQKGLAKIEQYVGVPLKGIGVGPERDQFVYF